MTTKITLSSDVVVTRSSSTSNLWTIHQRNVLDANKVDTVMLTREQILKLADELR